jgi:hypothetical protein
MELDRPLQPDRPIQRVSAHLAILRFPPPFDQVGSRCLHCSSQLSLHQPDPQSPERLIGVCEDCKHWFLIDVLSDVTGGVMVWLPDLEVIRDLSRENSSHGISLMPHEADRGHPPPTGPIDGSGPSA